MRAARMVGIGSVACAALAAVPVAAPAASHRTCRVPHLVGLTLSAARHRANAAGCTLALHGAKVQRPEVQTIRRQSPTHGTAPPVAVWVNPLCAGSADLPGPRGEPLRSKGQSQLVAGLYLVGGPLRFRSVPDCESLQGTPGPGVVTVANSATGATVATQTVYEAYLAMIPLPPGTYKVTAVFDGATLNGVHPTVGPTTVEIPPATTVRQDLYLNIP